MGDSVGEGTSDPGTLNASSSIFSSFLDRSRCNIDNARADLARL